MLDKPWKGYYLTAYGIAVKHGFRGTEEEWLSSLEGKPGAAAELRYNKNAKAIEWRSEGSDTWEAIVPLSELQGELVSATLSEAEEAAKSAGTAKADAMAAADAAKKDAMAASAAEKKILSHIEEYGTTVKKAYVSGDVLYIQTSDGKVFSTGDVRGRKGDTGNSGVYIGAEEPLDPDVKVWIDPTGQDGMREIINILSRLKYTDGGVQVDLSEYLREDRGELTLSEPTPAIISENLREIMLPDEIAGYEVYDGMGMLNGKIKMYFRRRWYYDVKFSVCAYNCDLNTFTLEKTFDYNNALKQHVGTGAGTPEGAYESLGGGMKRVSVPKTETDEETGAITEKDIAFILDLNKDICIDCSTLWDGHVYNDGLGYDGNLYIKTEDSEIHKVEYEGERDATTGVLFATPMPVWSCSGTGPRSGRDVSFRRACLHNGELFLRTGNNLGASLVKLGKNGIEWETDTLQKSTIYREAMAFDDDNLFMATGDYYTLDDDLAKIQISDGAVIWEKHFSFYNSSSSSAPRVGRIEYIHVEGDYLHVYIKKRDVDVYWGEHHLICCDTGETIRVDETEVYFAAGTDIADRGRVFERANVLYAPSISNSLDTLAPKMLEVQYGQTYKFK